jgi:hypothetical protein
MKSLRSVSVWNFFYDHGQVKQGSLTFEEDESYTKAPEKAMDGEG